MYIFGSRGGDWGSGPPLKLCKKCCYQICSNGQQRDQLHSACTVRPTPPPPPWEKYLDLPMMYLQDIFNRIPTFITPEKGKLSEIFSYFSTESYVVGIQRGNSDKWNEYKLQYARHKSWHIQSHQNRLTFSTLLAKEADVKLILSSLLFGNRVWHFIQIVSRGKLCFHGNVTKTSEGVIGQNWKSAWLSLRHIISMVWKFCEIWKSFG